MSLYYIAYEVVEESEMYKKYECRGAGIRNGNESLHGIPAFAVKDPTRKQIEYRSSDRRTAKFRSAPAKCGRAPFVII
jgi:hypothetical protein